MKSQKYLENYLYSALLPNHGFKTHEKANEVGSTQNFLPNFAGFKT